MSTPFNKKATYFPLYALFRVYEFLPNNNMIIFKIPAKKPAFDTFFYCPIFLRFYK